MLFETDAANLDPSDTNGVRDVYLLNRSAGSLERVSLDGTGAQGTQPARGGQLTPDASRVVFATASAFDPAAPAGVEQIYVRDRSAATTTLASLESMGPADADCHSASISQDGRLVVFTSSADNLNPTPNGLDDVFERDLVTGALRLVSRRDSGLVSSSNASWTSPWGPAHTADGLRRVFLTDVKGMNALFDPNGFTDVYLDACDLARACPAVQINLTESGGQPSTETFEVSVSENGAYVAWTTTSANVVSVPAGDSRKDVFVSHLATGAVEQASVAFGAGDSNGACFEATLSASGRIVAFSSQATNLLATPQSMWGVYVRDLDAGTTERIDVTPAGGEPDGIGSQPWISACGRYVAFKSGATDIVPGVPGLGGGPNQTQIFLRDRSAGTTALISVSPGGVAGDKESAAPFVTPGGRFVAFETDAENLDPGDTNGVGDIYLCDRAQGTLEQVSVGTGGVQGQRSWAGEVTADGRFVSFLNAFPFDPTAPAGITQLYRRDRVTDTTVLVSVGAGGASTSSLSRYSMSGDGSKFVFDTRAANLQLGLWSGNAKVFLKDLATGALTLLSLNADGTLSMPNSEVSPWGAAFSGDGLSTAFLSRGSGITPDPDPNGQVDVFMDRCPAGGGATYCTAEVNSLGCTPAIGASGTPSASGASAFSVTCDQVVSQRLGLFYYSVVGPSALPFQGGLRCVASPVRRTPLTSSGGSATPDCTGVLSIDFAAWIAGGADPALVSGQRVWGQWWSRDSGSSFATNLSDAIAFDIAP